MKLRPNGRKSIVIDRFSVDYRPLERLCCPSLTTVVLLSHPSPHCLPLPTRGQPTSSIKARIGCTRSPPIDRKWSIRPALPHWLKLEDPATSAARHPGKPPHQFLPALTVPPWKTTIFSATTPSWLDPAGWVMEPPQGNPSFSSSRAKCWIMP